MANKSFAKKVKTFLKGGDERKINKFYDNVLSTYKDNIELLERENKKLKEQIGSRDVEKMDVNDINLGVVALTDFYNLSGGSIGTLDLYQLLQKYFLDKEKRKEINEIVRR